MTNTIKDIYVKLMKPRQWNIDEHAEMGCLIAELVEDWKEVDEWEEFIRRRLADYEDCY